jgi:hypothetical protein
MTDHHQAEGGGMRSTLEKSRQERISTGDRAIAIYREWRLRHLSEPDENGHVLLRLAPARYRGTEDSKSS